MFGRWFYFELATKFLNTILNPKRLHSKWKGKKLREATQVQCTQLHDVCFQHATSVLHNLHSVASVLSFYILASVHAWMHSTCLKILQLGRLLTGFLCCISLLHVKDLTDTLPRRGSLDSSLLSCMRINLYT